MKGLLRVYSLFLTILMIMGVTLGQEHFVARLTGEQQIPPVNSASRGTAAFTLTDQGLNYIITIDSMANFTEAHFHFGAIGDTGAIVKTITGNFRGNTAVGVWTKSDVEPLTDQMISALLNGKIYVNVHTTSHPNGEIRGQIIPASGTGFKATLSALEQVPSVASGASGTASLLLTEVGVAYSITLTGITNISSGQFRLGVIGANGDVLKTITFQGNKASGIWTKSDAEPLTDRFINALLSDSLYISINTSANPNGEIRGQVFQSGGHFFAANLSGSQEIPINTSLAKGTGYFSLTKSGLAFAVSVTIGENIIAANLVNAPSGMTGFVVKDLTPLLNGKTLTGLWKFTDADNPLTKEIVSELLKGNLYINYYTAKYPNGEIRGQLNPANGVCFKSFLTGTQVRPAVTNPGKGVGNFILSTEGLNYNISLDMTDTIKTAHFYIGKIGMEIGYRTSYLKSIREFRGKSASGIWRFSDSTEALTPQILQSLLKDEVLVNIRTTRDTLGGLRGQLIQVGGTSFSARLSAKQETPKTKSNAFGTGNFTLTDIGLIYRITVDSLVVAASHFHLAPIGQSGNVVKEITPDFVNNTAKGIWTLGGDQGLTRELIKALMTGQIYVNVHTPNNPNGEIRGQLLINEGWGFTASLNGLQEVPPDTSAASGTAALTFTPNGLIYDLSITGIKPTSLGFNKAPVSQSGDSVRDILSEANGALTVSGAWITAGRLGGLDSLNNDHISSLFNGDLYVNAASATYPSGEIRGQILPTVQGAVLSVKNSNNLTPKAFDLQQNFPNPFNPSTIIRFSVTSFGPVNLSVYNVLGQKILTLVNNSLSAGNYEVNFNASNLSSGIYIYRLQAGKNSEVKKMMIMK
ncbi:MAG: CHRD domain-containing protein [Bacteroidota bacterium]|nr:CHRD domain-containing protein [Bacteroidota bacterium]